MGPAACMTDILEELPSPKLIMNLRRFLRLASDEAGLQSSQCEEPAVVGPRKGLSGCLPQKTLP